MNKYKIAYYERVKKPVLKTYEADDLGEIMTQIFLYDLKDFKIYQYGADNTENILLKIKITYKSLNDKKLYKDIEK